MIWGNLWQALDDFTAYAQQTQSMTALVLQANDAIVPEPLAVQVQELPVFDDSGITDRIDEVTTAISELGGADDLTIQPVVTAEAAISVAGLVIDALSIGDSVLSGVTEGTSGEDSWFEQIDAYNRSNALLNRLKNQEENFGALHAELFALSNQSGVSYADAAQTVIKLLDSTNAFSSAGDAIDFSEQIYKLSNRYGLDYLTTMDQLAIAMADGEMTVKEIEKIFGSAPGAIRWMGDVYSEYIRDNQNSSSTDKQLSANAFADAMQDIPSNFAEELEATLSYANTWESFKNSLLLIFKPLIDFLGAAAQWVNEHQEELSLIAGYFAEIVMSFFPDFNGNFASTVQSLQGAFQYFAAMLIRWLAEAYVGISSWLSYIRFRLYSFLAGLFSFATILASIYYAVVQYVVNPVIRILNSILSSLHDVGLLKEFTLIPELYVSEDIVDVVSGLAESYGEKAINESIQYFDNRNERQEILNDIAGWQEQLIQGINEGNTDTSGYLLNMIGGIASLFGVGKDIEIQLPDFTTWENGNAALTTENEVIIELSPSLIAASDAEQQQVQQEMIHMTVNPTANIYSKTDETAFIEKMIEQMQMALSGRSSR